jgi:hypothetical protein
MVIPSDAMADFGLLAICVATHNFYKNQSGAGLFSWLGGIAAAGRGHT